MKKLVVLEGMDAVGKSSAAKALQSYLVAKGTTASLYREPGGTPFGESIRGILLGKEPITPLTQFYLFQAARVELMQVLIKDPAEIIIMDRFWPSTWAYQVQGDGVSQDLCWQAQHQIDKMIKVHLNTDIFFLVLPEPTRLLRLQASGKAADRYEGRDAAFQTRVAKGYENLQGTLPRKCIDASKPVADIVSDIISRFR